MTHLQINISYEKLKFLSEFDTLLMFINIHTRSHIFLKISMFCQKIITFSIRAHLMIKSAFLPIFQFFGQNSHFCLEIDIDKHHCPFVLKFAQHDFMTVLQKSLICPKTNTFWIKWQFLPPPPQKKRRCHQRLTHLIKQKILL